MKTNQEVSQGIRLTDLPRWKKAHQDAEKEFRAHRLNAVELKLRKQEIDHIYQQKAQA